MAKHAPLAPRATGKGGRPKYGTQSDQANCCGMQPGVFSLNSFFRIRSRGIGKIGKAVTKKRNKRNKSRSPTDHSRERGGAFRRTRRPASRWRRPAHTPALLMADLVLERFQRFRYLDGPRSQPPLSLADNSVADVLAIPFPDF